MEPVSENDLAAIAKQIAESTTGCGPFALVSTGLGVATYSINPDHTAVLLREAANHFDRMHEPYALEDTVLHDRIKELVAEHNIQVIVETGTFHGLSTSRFANMVPIVFSVESSTKALSVAHENLRVFQKPNVALCFGWSPAVLHALSPILPTNTLYFLDAHEHEGHGDWPILYEINAIKKGTGILIIHDAEAPSHPELGYDIFNGQTLDYGYLREALTQWSTSHRIEYNSEAANCRLPRGVLYAFPN